MKQLSVPESVLIMASDFGYPHKRPAVLLGADSRGHRMVHSIVDSCRSGNTDLLSEGQKEGSRLAGRMILQVDREDELRTFNGLLDKKDAALVLLYGRRRIGKTSSGVHLRN